MLVRKVFSLVVVKNSSVVFNFLMVWVVMWWIRSKISSELILIII